MKHSFKFRWITFYSALVLISLLNLPACNESVDKKEVIQENTYVGSESCKSCHEVAFNDWQDSHHDWSMKLPDSETVLADFNNVDFESDGVKYHFSNEGKKYAIQSEEIDGSVSTYEVAYTFGVTPLQQYLIKFPDGRYQALRASWDTEEKKWFHQYKDLTIEVDDWLHWTRGGQNWNTMCAECHSTNLKKNYNIQTDAFNTTYDEINVGCESCHGPASNHIVWAEAGSLDTFPQIIVEGDNQLSQLNSCAGCHARRVKLTQVMRPEVDFDDQFMLQNITSEYYHGDGQILEEDYVYGSFVQTKMYHKDVKCSDCHNSHSLKLHYEGNLLCMQCHEPKYNNKEHHFHDVNTEGSMCIDCHMTGKTYMGNDFRRDHSFRVPRPDQSVKYGTPNACMDCHSDKSDQWAAESVTKWYGPTRAENYTDNLLLALNQEIGDKEYSELLLFINRQDLPGIARATTIEYLPSIDTEAEIQALLIALNDSTASVRYNALRKFSDFPLQQKMPIALKHVSDEKKAVRIAAANLIVEVPIDEIEVGDRQGVRKARTELLIMLNSNADFPLGRLQLGDYYIRQNLVNKAIVHYEKALEMDYLLLQVYSNLATAYNIIGNNEKGISVLNRLIELEPEYARAYYLRGLLRHEMENSSAAIEDLELAVKYDENNFRYRYNLSNMYFRLGKIEEAEMTIKEALRVDPSSLEALELLKLIQENR